MTDLVDPSEIESLVGVKRHPTEHYGRAVSAEQRVYILHSAACRDSGIDLRECPFSVALDHGIDALLSRWRWRHVLDRPVQLEVWGGYLLPEFWESQKAIESSVKAAAGAPMPHLHPHIHVTRDRCELKHCGWTGFHFHWRHRRYRSARELGPAEMAEFDEACQRMNAERNAR